MDASLIAIWGRSGAGKSTLAVNLACALAKTRCVGLISSNLQYGHLQSFFGQTIESGKGLLNALENPAHSKDYVWKAASVSLLENIFLLTVPNDYTGLQADSVSMEAVEDVLDHARALFDVIIVDGSEDITNPVSGVSMCMPFHLS
jgi:MinD-like ATPase involved in chromosome partitioning or flagellar assembly